MQRDVVIVLPSDSVEQAARLMLEHRVSGLPVADGRGNLVGIVTEADRERYRPQPALVAADLCLAERLAAEFVKSTGRRVKDVMTREVLSVPDTALLAEIAELFDREKIKRAPVLRDGKLVGIVTRTDLLRALVGFGSARPGDLRTVEFR